MGFYIDMINVNQGDSFLLTLDKNNSDCYYVLIDGGSKEMGLSLVNHLKKIAPEKIDVVVATHIDNDHIGGLIDVIENLKVGCFCMNVPGNLSDWIKRRAIFKRLGEKIIPIRKLVENLSTAEELLRLISQNNIPMDSLYTGRQWSPSSDFNLKILNPTPDRMGLTWSDEILRKTIEEPILEKGEVPKTSPRNNSGIVLELAYKGSPYALFTADVSADVLREVIGENTYSFLKIPHHGSETGLDEDLVKKIKPNQAYLSVGENNFGHPSTEVLDILKESGAKVFCTNRTKYCRKECNYKGFGNLCHKHDKESRPGWSSVEPKKCINNQ